MDFIFCNSEDKFLFSLEESLRAFLLKLNICDSLLKPLEEGKSWPIISLPHDKILDLSKFKAFVDSKINVNLKQKCFFGW